MCINLFSSFTRLSLFKLSTIIHSCFLCNLTVILSIYQYLCIYLCKFPPGEETNKIKIYVVKLT